MTRMVGDDGRQQRVAVFDPRDRKREDPQSVAQRRRQWIDAIGGRHVRHVREIEIRLKRRIGIAGRGLRFEKPEQSVPKPAVVGPSGGLFQFVDDDERIGDAGARDGEKCVAGLGLSPSPRGSCEGRAVALRGVGPPNANAEEFAEPPGEP